MANKNSNELEKGLASLSQRSICCVCRVYEGKIHIKLENHKWRKNLINHFIGNETQQPE